MQSFTPSTPDEELRVIREEASQWIVSLGEADAEGYQRLRTECELWQAGDPRRRRVLMQMEQMCAALGRMQKRGRGRRRTTLMGLFLLGAVIAGQLPWSVWTADHRTAIAEIRNVSLPDGSIAVLNGDSAISVEYTGDHRVVRLERGELMVTVQKDAAHRPFSISVPDGMATALGTRYSVRLNDDHSVVTVQHSKVRLVPRKVPGHAVTLAAGQRARLTSTAVGAVEEGDLRAPDWVGHRLIFNDAPLDEVIERLSGYQRGLLTLDQGLSGRDLRFTGVLPAGDTGRALSLLAGSLSLEIRRITPYITWLEDRQQKNI